MERHFQKERHEYTSGGFVRPLGGFLFPESLGETDGHIQRGRRGLQPVESRERKPIAQSRKGKHALESHIPIFVNCAKRRPLVRKSDSCNPQ